MTIKRIKNKLKFTDMKTNSELRKNYRTNQVETIEMNSSTEAIALQKIAGRIIYLWWILCLSSIFSITLGLAIMN